MKIHLISYTKDPLKSIATGILNIGIGKDITSLDEITYEEAKKAFEDTVKSYLDSPLEFASFNFFWEDIPLYLRSELVRARVGWSYAERSMRFYQAEERNPIDKIDWKYFPSIKAESRVEFLDLLKEQINKYIELKENFTTQDARTIIGSWFGTALQTSCTYRALRNTMAVRLSSQAHPAWQDATQQIKELVTQVDKTLGDNLIDICQMQGRCVWHSKLDRPCKECEERGRQTNHIHAFNLKTKSGTMQCSCGKLENEG